MEVVLVDVVVVDTVVLDVVEEDVLEEDDVLVVDSGARKVWTTGGGAGGGLVA